MWKEVKSICGNMSGVMEFWPQEFWSEFQFCNLRSNYDAVWFGFCVSSFEFPVWILESGKNQMLKLLCIYRNGFQHLSMLHWPCIWGWLCTSAQVLLVLILTGKPLKSRFRFTIKYLTFWSAVFLCRLKACSESSFLSLGRDWSFMLLFRNKSAAVWKMFLQLFSV